MTDELKPIRHIDYSIGVTANNQYQESHIRSEFLPEFENQIDRAYKDNEGRVQIPVEDPNTGERSDLMADDIEIIIKVKQ